MLFRRKIFLLFFALAIVPTLLVLALSAYLLNGALSRVGASGLENSLLVADSLTRQTQDAIGRMLSSKLPDKTFWNGVKPGSPWRLKNDVDLAFMSSQGQTFISTQDSTYVDYRLNSGNFPLGLSHFNVGGRDYLIYTRADSSAQMNYGCGILMPADYSSLGREFSTSLSASASLGLYKAFSIKLLAAATAIAIIFALAAAFILSTLLSRQLVRPLESLTVGSAIFGHGGFDYRIKMKGNDEFSHLAESFNSMAAEIEARQKELLLAERLAAWREVARRIAHEIRNPLTPINIELYRLKKMCESDKPNAPDEISRSLTAISAQIEILQEMAAQFATFAKEPELKPVQCSLADIISDSVAVMKSCQGLQVAVSLPDNMPRLMLDSAMMRRVFVNIIKNSVEASSGEIKISISGGISGDKVIISIKDNGPGFPTEKLTRIDQPYLTTKKTGSGLGMAIIKKIIDEHGGSVRFYNDSGAVVEITLPISGK